jgi:septal ring factor EnvC (AmiA/AmiB activator)
VCSTMNMELLNKQQQEKRLLEDQIQALKESISTEIKERQELEVRLKVLRDNNNSNGNDGTPSSTTRAQEVEECFNRIYAPKLAQYEKMLLKMNALKVKLDAAK